MALKTLEDCAARVEVTLLGTDRLHPLADALRRGEVNLYNISFVEREARGLLEACATVREILNKEQGLA